MRIGCLVTCVRRKVTSVHVSPLTSHLSRRIEIRLPSQIHPLYLEFHGRPAIAHSAVALRELYPRARARRRRDVARLRRRRAPARAQGRGEGAGAGARRGDVGRAVRARDPASPRRCSRRTSSRSSRPADSTGSPTTRCRSSRARACAPGWAAGRCPIAEVVEHPARRRARARVRARARRRAPRHQAGQRPALRRHRGGHRLRHREGHRGARSRRSGGCDAHAARHGDRARRRTWRPSRRRAIPRPIIAPTSTRSAAWRTSCSRASRRSPACRPHKLLAAHMAETPRAGRGAASRLLRRRSRARDAVPGEGSRRSGPRAQTSCSRRLDAVASPSSAQAAVRRSFSADAADASCARWASTRLAFVGVAIVARLLVDHRMGLPDWVFQRRAGRDGARLPGDPVHGYTQYVARMVAQATPTLHAAAARSSRPSAAARWRSSRSRRARTCRGGAPRAAASRRSARSRCSSPAIMVLRVLGIGPAGSLLAAGKLTAQDSVLVAAFDAAGKDSALGDVVPRRCAPTSRSRAPCSVVSDERARRRAASACSGPTRSRVDFALAREIAQREGIKAVVARQRRAGGQRATSSRRGW